MQRGDVPLEDLILDVVIVLLDMLCLLMKLGVACDKDDSLSSD